MCPVSLENLNFKTKSWKPGQIIYDWGTPSFDAFFIIEGEVDVLTPKGLILNTIGPSEIFGEASLLLNKKRSVITRAGTAGTKALLIPKSFLTDLQTQSPILSAILRNVQLRLADSNEQSARYADEIEKVLKLAKSQGDTNSLIEKKLTDIQKRLTKDMGFRD